MKIVDLFSGCGGLSLGFQIQGFNVVAAFEWWDTAVKCYEENFKHMRSLYSEPFCTSKGSDQKPWGLGPIEEWLSPWLIMRNQWDGDETLYQWSCVDCRHTVGATKKRPDFWPNDHE